MIGISNVPIARRYTPFPTKKAKAQISENAQDVAPITIGLFIGYAKCVPKKTQASQTACVERAFLLDFDHH
jgi:hypothetical protein